jgi:superfamily II DNA or RNA helicase
MQAAVDFERPPVKYQPRDYQEAAIKAGLDFFRRKSGPNEIQVLPTGCHAKGAKILMHDLSVKAVEDVVVGDLLMGPDSSPRKVLQLCRGAEMMYRVVPKKGDPFVVNAGHILHLVCTNERKNPSRVFDCTTKGGDVEFVSVRDYVSKSKSWKHLRKLSRCNVIGKELGHVDFKIDPWHLGVILGDGCLLYNQISVCSPDIEIELGLYELAEQWGCFVTKSAKDGGSKASNYSIVKREGRGRNPLINALREMGLMGLSAEYKAIPDEYIKASPFIRASILAGLIDTDGSHDGRGGYDFISKSKTLADQVVFIARSLGITASIKECEKGCQGGFTGTYHRVSLSGHTYNIPCRVERKKAAVRRINKDPLRMGFDIEEVGEGDFYGFTLDGDHLYMTSDFIIHHNSGKSLIIAGIAERLQEPTLILQPSKEILQQNYEKFTSYGGHAGIFSASVGRKDLGMVTFASLASIMAKDRTGARRSMQHFLHYKNIIIDECHLQSNSVEGMLKDFLAELSHPRILGLTATPFRLYPHTDRDGTRDSMLKFLTRTSPRIFGKVGYHVQVSELKERGYLANCRYFDVRSELSHGFDRNAIKVNSTGADYDEEALQKYYDTIDFKTDIVKLIRRVNATGKQVLCFMSSVADAEFVSRELGNSATVTGKTSKAERDRAEEDFKSGKLRSVVNCGVWTVGFDYPALKVVLLARPLRSLVMYYQMLGRAIRPYNDECAWMICATGNLGVFGRVEDLRVEFDPKNDLPMITGSGGRILTGVPLKEQEFFQGEVLK